MKKPVFNISRNEPIDEKSNEKKEKFIILHEKQEAKASNISVTQNNEKEKEIQEDEFTFGIDPIKESPINDINTNNKNYLDNNNIIREGKEIIDTKDYPLFYNNINNTKYNNKNCKFIYKYYIILFIYIAQTMPNLNLQKNNRILNDNLINPFKVNKKRHNSVEEGKSFLESFMAKKKQLFEKFIGRKRELKIERLKEYCQIKEKRIIEDFQLIQNRVNKDILLEKEFMIANFELEMEKRKFMKKFKVKSIDGRELEKMIQLDEESEEDEEASVSAKIKGK